MDENGIVPEPQTPNWSGRLRQRDALKRPKTYWEEYVVTDDWYVNELTSDIPPDELWAACEDEDLAQDECVHESDAEIDAETEEDILEEEEEDDSYVQDDDESTGDEETSECDDSDSDDGTCSEADSPVQRPAKGKRRG